MSQHEPRILSRGVVCHQPDRLFGYYGWPTIARLPDQTLLVGASGPRMDHVCPFGATALFVSRDDGKAWTPPMIVNNSPMDDRDVGLLSLGGPRVMLSWFTLDAKYYAKFREGLQKRLPPYAFALCEAMASQYTDALNAKEAGSFARISEDGGVTW
ncbi:MAG TPA: sialidase family protein, partial [Clostridia bacterium]|nr:sialidase family protein [Clostridia bacterium]